MMKNAEQTIGNLIDKQGVPFINSIDKDCVLRFTAEIGRYCSNFKSKDFVVE